MIFNKDEIVTDNSFSNAPSYVRARTVIERVEEAVNDKLAFERDYAEGDWIHLEDAEEFIVQMHALIKTFKK